MAVEKAQPNRGFFTPLFMEALFSETLQTCCTQYFLLRNRRLQTFGSFLPNLSRARLLPVGLMSAWCSSTNDWLQQQQRGLHEIVGCARAICRVVYNPHLPSTSPSLFSFFLHTYLVSKSSDHELGASVWMACIAQRGVDPCSIVLRGHRRRNF